MSERKITKLDVVIIGIVAIIIASLVYVVKSYTAILSVEKIMDNE